MAYTAGFSVNVGDPTKASDVTTLAANDDFLKAAVDAIMADSATPSSTLKATVVLADGVTATTQSAGNNTTRVATTAFVKTAVDASSTDPGGSNTQIQYNNSGAFGASANLTFDGTNLTVAGELDAATLDISGDADIGGTLETDALTIDGTTLLANDSNDRITTATGSGTLNGEANLTFDGSTLQVAGALTVGVDDTGHDVQFFGASAGHYMLWDESADEMILRIGSTSTYAANTETGNLKLVNAGSDTDNQSVGIAFDVGAGNVGAIGKARIDAVHNGTGANSDLVFATQASGTVTERMRIDSSGNVMMDASGNFVASGFLNVENTANGQNLYVGARNTGFTQHVIRAFCYRTANSAYNFLDCQSDMAGSNDTEFKLRGDGEAYADGSWNNSGADYQEFFESSDGSALEVGKSVVMDGDKVRLYNASSDSTDNIVGVVRPKADNKNSAVVGNTAWNHWTDKYLTDDWGVYLREDVTVWEWDDVLATESDVVEAVAATYYEDGDDIPEGKEVGDVKTAEVVGVAVGDVVIKAGSCYERNELAKDSEWTPPAGATSSTQSVRKRNPDYDEERTYAPREERDEWNLIGLLGQVQIKANEPTRPTWIKMKQISDSVDLWLVR